jgi:predicted metal-binding membrane protein
LSWVYIIGLNEGGWPSLMAMPMRHGWSTGDLLLTYAMWVVMMIAMMTPAVAPTILLVAAVERRRGHPQPLVRATLSLVGYLTVWAAASAIASLLQYGLHEGGLIYGAASDGAVRRTGEHRGASRRAGVFRLSGEGKRGYAGCPA